jgi:hypothetical protein
VASEPESERTSRRAPAPWQLRADAYAFMLRSAALPVDASVHRGPWALALFADYHASPVGPYRELLLIPGTITVGGKARPSISKIYVSTRASADNGRDNWGIVKELAAFAVERRSERLDHLTVRVDGQIAVELTIEKTGPRLPFGTWMLPGALRTLAQRIDGKTFEVTPAAKGLLRWSRVKHAWSDATLFPGMTPANIAACISLSSVALTFPEARVR